MLLLGQLYTYDTNDNNDNNDNNDDNDTNDDNNDTQWTNHHCIGSLACMPMRQKAVTIRPDDVAKRENPSIWIDTYYVDPNQTAVDASQSLTTDTHVGNLDSGK